MFLMEICHFEHQWLHFALQYTASRQRVLKKVEDILWSNRLADRLTRSLAHMSGYRKVTIRVDEYGSDSVLYFFTDTETWDEPFVAIGFDIEGDYSDTLVIKNMVTHPEMLRGSGIGKKVLSDFLAKVREEKEIKKIIATQVQYSAEWFWEKCSFRKIAWHNLTNDFEYIG